MRSRPSPSMVVALVSLFISLTVSAAALPGKNKVDSGDIKKNAVRSSDIRNGAVNGAEVADESLTGDDIKGLTGADINESTLAGVPLSGAAGGDLTGNYPNPTIGANAVGTAEVDGSLTGADIFDGSLTSADIDGSLTGSNIANGSLTSADIDGSLTGSNIADTSSIGSLDIDESSLSTVPTATTATSAGFLESSLPGSVVYGADTFNFDAPTTASNTVIASFDGLVLIADCDTLVTPNVQLFATPTTTNSYLNSTTITTGGAAASVVDTSFDAQTADLLPTGDGSGTIVYRNGDDVTEAPSDNVSTIVFAYEENPPSGTADDCQLMGSVFGGG